MKEINKPKLVLVEGKDEVNFLTAILKTLNKQNEVEIIEVGGKQKFKTELPALINIPGFSSKVKKLAIIRDADDNAEDAFKSISNLAKKNDLKPPERDKEFSDADISVGIFIMPGDSENGMLEDLCLRTRENDTIMTCVNSYFECLETKGVPKPGNMAKAKCQVFMSAMHEIKNSVGLGALSNYWDLNHESLNGIKNFLDKLCE